MPQTPSAPDIPQALATPHRRWSIQLVWLIPIIAALIGGWLAIKAVLDRGPTITISFSTAEGLEPEKTRVKYRNVDIGRVTGITFARDRSRVIATVQLSKQIEPLLVEDTRFWVVRPQLVGTQVSGLGTLLSGAYIGLDAGKSEESAREFTGLDTPPIVTGDRPGRHFLLRADNLGSLDVGSPIYFRRVQVGNVVGFKLDKDGGAIQVNIFVNSPYQQYVKGDTRFWHASGLDVALDASGIRVNTESVTSILLGGVAFQAPPDGDTSLPAKENEDFTLYSDRVKALRLPDTAEETFHVVFNESVRGLSIGAPVDYRGVVVGEVSAITVDYDAGKSDVQIPVEVKLYPDRLRGTSVQDATGPGVLIDKLVARGMRAQLRSGSLLTGQLFVALDFFPTAAKAAVRKRHGRTEIPVVVGSVTELQETLLGIVRKLDRLPLEAVVGDARKSLTTLERTLAITEQAVRRIDSDLTPQAGRTLAELSRTLSGVETTLGSARRSLAGVDALLADNAPLQRDVRETLQEVTRAAEALRSLSDYLERNPGAILRGRNVEPAK